MGRGQEEEGNKKRQGKARGGEGFRKEHPDLYHYRADSREEGPDGESQEEAAVYRTGSGDGALKRQGEYRLEDLPALPEDERWELIDGHLIRIDAPTIEHQLILGELYMAFRSCMDRHKAECLALLSPTDVQLDMDDRTIVEPDLVLLCDPKKLRRKRIFGAPDLLVEILSPSTHAKDMFWKNRKYQKAGVREYWMVDPQQRKVMVNIFESGREEFRSRLYDLDEEVPVWISKGQCRIDLAPIGRLLDAVYGEEDRE